MQLSVSACCQPWVLSQHLPDRMSPVRAAIQKLSKVLSNVLRSCCFLFHGHRHPVGLMLGLRGKCRSSLLPHPGCPKVQLQLQPQPKLAQAQAQASHSFNTSQTPPSSCTIWSSEVSRRQPSATTSSSIVSSSPPVQLTTLTPIPATDLFATSSPTPHPAYLSESNCCSSVFTRQQALLGVQAT